MQEEKQYSDGFSKFGLKNNNNIKTNTAIYHLANNAIQNIWPNFFSYKDPKSYKDTEGNDIAKMENSDKKSQAHNSLYLRQPQDFRLLEKPQDINDYAANSQQPITTNLKLLKYFGLISISKNEIQFHEDRYKEIKELLIKVQIKYDQSTDKSAYEQTLKIVTNNFDTLDLSKKTFVLVEQKQATNNQEQTTINPEHVINDTKQSFLKKLLQEPKYSLIVGVAACLGAVTLLSTGTAPFLGVLLLAAGLASIVASCELIDKSQERITQK
jgi:hypothetical protein